jgi:hypothetical protein
MLLFDGTSATKRLAPPAGAEEAEGGRQIRLHEMLVVC